MGLGVPGWSREGPGARPGPGPGCWGTRAEGIRLAQRRRPPPGHPGSPGGCSSRRGRRAGGGVGAPHLGRGGGSGGRRLPLCPPDIAAAPAAGCRDEAAAEFSVPATPSRGACGQGYFLTYLKASVGSRALPLPPPRALCSVPAGDACGFTVWDRLFFGQISTCKKCPASKLTGWAVTDTPPHPRACCGCSVS